MKLVTNLTLIIVLSLISTITINLVLRGNTKIAKENTTEISDVESMKLTVNNNLQKYGIETIHVSNNNFKNLLIQHVGENENLLALVESSTPFSFFIQNNSSKEVIGISLRWKFVKSNNEVQEIPQIEVNPGVLMGLKPLDPQMRGKTSLINSKNVRFISYFSDIVGQSIVLANMRLNNPLINYKYNYDTENIEKHISFVNSQKEKILNDVSDISVTVDGIAFTDGTFVGADQNLFFDSLNGQVQARKDFLISFTESKSFGKTDSEILEDFLSKSSNELLKSLGPHSNNASPEQVFDVNYKNYLKALKRELAFKRSKMSDDYIVSQIQSVRVSDFVKLRKID